jgi:hypothetical protein
MCPGYYGDSSREPKISDLSKFCFLDENKVLLFISFPAEIQTNLAFNLGTKYPYITAKDTAIKLVVTG